MARGTSKGSKKKARTTPMQRAWRYVRRLALRLVGGVLLLILVAVAFYAFFNPPTTPYMFQESRRLGGVDQTWTAWDDIAPVMGRSAVAAEDANFCNHWGFDMGAIRAALAAGGNRGASTISQQVVKNVYLWHGRSYLRKALEAGITPMMEMVWSKRRILEVYLNIAEFDEGVFGIEAASQHYFGISARDLNATQAARLAAILPNPKGRSASRPSATVQRRAASIRDGAATIRADGRSACFES